VAKNVKLFMRPWAKFIIDYQFPFRISQHPITTEERRQRDMRTLGSTRSAAPSPPNVRTMQAMDLISTFKTYSVEIQDLRQGAHGSSVRWDSRVRVR
jgi:hypothetical protein